MCGLAKGWLNRLFSGDPNIYFYFGLVIAWGGSTGVRDKK